MHQGEHKFYHNGLALPRPRINDYDYVQRFVCLLARNVYDQLLSITRYFDNLLQQLRKSSLYLYNLTIKTLHNVI